MGDRQLSLTYRQGAIKRAIAKGVLLPRCKATQEAFLKKNASATYRRWRLGY